MAAHYAPKDLKLTPIAEVPRGSLFMFPDGDSRKQALKLDSAAQPKNDFLVLEDGPSRPFRVDTSGALEVQVLYPADALLVRPGARAFGSSNQPSGSLMLVKDDALIYATQNREVARVSLRSWQSLEIVGGPIGGRITYGSWELGMLDHRGEFVSLYSHAPTP